DISPARELLAYEPKTPLRDGLAQTIAWYEPRLAGRRPSTGGSTELGEASFPPSPFAQGQRVPIRPPTPSAKSTLSRPGRPAPASQRATRPARRPARPWRV